MDLKPYLEKMGDSKAAELFGVKKRTVAAWRRGERHPKRSHAEIIVKRSPVTFEGIYGARSA